ncbi:hypothetical protein EV648_12157 [Kribbella sp. VKM Ac-2568]|nr:hypothetical protein EV648_12157 [Kribbella sp. VKM Ac-2568]
MTRTKRLPTRPTIEWYRDNLVEIARRLSQERSARIALLSLPVIREDLDSEPVRRSARYSAMVGEVADETDLPTDLCTSARSTTSATTTVTPTASAGGSPGGTADASMNRSPARPQHQTAPAAATVRTLARTSRARRVFRRIQRQQSMLAVQPTHPFPQLGSAITTSGRGLFSLKGKLGRHDVGRGECRRFGDEVRQVASDPHLPRLEVELPARIVRERVDHGEAGRPEAQSQPDRGIRFFEYRGKRRLEVFLKLAIPTGLCLDSNEQPLRHSHFFMLGRPSAWLGCSVRAQRLLPSLSWPRIRPISCAKLHRLD